MDKVMETIHVELGEWVSVFGIQGYVCGATGGTGHPKTSLDVCFRPHAYEGHSFADHREIRAPFVGVSVIGKLENPPFDTQGAGMKKQPFPV